MNIILILSLLIGLGFIFGKLAHYIKLPTVSGYLIAGLLIGLLPIDFTAHTSVFNTISEITLSFIAFGIGSEFVLSNLKKSGKKIFIITLLEVIGAIVVVFAAMYLLVPSSFPSFSSNEKLSFALILGTMSAATAPAATILVIRQFKADGPVTKTILPVAALDDVSGIIAFGIVLPIARILTPIDPANALEPTLWNILKGPLIEVFGSLAVGLVLGIILSIVTKVIDPKDELQVKTIFFILAGLGLSLWLGLSPLLVNIMVGATLANLRKHADRSFSAMNEFVPIFYILFFTIAGASLDLSILTKVGLIGIAYVIARAIGKILGAYVGAVASKAEPTVKKYLGFALLPQGGISIGLSILVTKYLPENIATPIVTIILFSILIYESTGPIFAKLALQKADELFKLDSPSQNDELILENNL
ncbi:MAG: cation:proton antiporter [Acholeplasma sp.]|nr:cation:proton antiporter [Acholeplasma sp.]